MAGRNERAEQEKRAAGRAAPQIDEATGQMINPHNPSFITQAPWYLNQNEPSLKHHRVQKEKQAAAFNIGYTRGTKGDIKTKFKKGACTNCGATTHQARDCTERPRKLGAKHTGKNLASDEFVENLEFDYAAKRDRWANYNPEDFSAVYDECGCCANEYSLYSFYSLAVSCNNHMCRYSVFRFTKHVYKKRTTKKDRQKFFATVQVVKQYDEEDDARKVKTQQQFAERAKQKKLKKQLRLQKKEARLKKRRERAGENKGGTGNGSPDSDFDSDSDSDADSDLEAEMADQLGERQRGIERAGGDSKPNLILRKRDRFHNLFAVLIYRNKK
jgi:hypothetical protein